MCKLFRSQSGVSLLEVLLVLAIATSMLILGIQQYRAYRFGADVEVAKSNIEKLFQAGARYYYANCYGQSDATGKLVTPGKLNPKNTDVGNKQQIQVSVKDGLVTPKYLNEQLDFVPFVADVPTEAGSQAEYDDTLYKNYAVQFNRIEDDRSICQEGSENTNPTLAPTCTKTKVIGKYITWTIQVAIKVKAQDRADLYKTLMGAQCVSSGGDKGVATCENAASFTATCEGLRGTPVTDPNYAVNQQNANNMGCPNSANPDEYSNYIVFSKRPATIISTGAGSENQQLIQFQQMYTTDGVGYLMNPATHDQQYYYCGG